jgi:hypothetical protein
MAWATTSIRTRGRVLEWVASAGLAVVEESEGDDYWHLILARPA